MIREIGSKKVIDMPASPTIKTSMKCAELREAGVDIIALSGGEPDFDTPTPIKDKCIEAINKNRTHYAIGPGTKELRTKIVEKMKNENGIEMDINNIFVTPGAKFGLYLAMQALINPGDEVMLITPNWVSYDPIIKAAGGVTVKVEVKEADGYRVTKELLMSHVTDKTKLLLYCSPCNPTGHIIDKDEANIIADFLEETGVYALADEIYERLSYSKKPYSVGSIEKVKNQVITIMGFSKGYAMTGFRLGWIAVPTHLCKLFKVLYGQTISCAPTFIMDAATVAFECKSDIEMMVNSYKTRGEKFIAKLNEIDGVSAEIPEGAFYAWVKFDKKGKNATEIADYLIDEAKVAGVAGIGFDETENKHIRFSFAQAESDLSEAANRIKTALDKL